MNIFYWVTAGVAVAAALISAPAAHGSTINTYTFTQVGWFDLISPLPTVGNPEPNVILSGSFTGTLQADGVIGLSDLTAFTETLNMGTAVLSQAKSQLTLFSFNTGGGASSLTIAGSPVFEANFCQGTAVFLTAACTLNFGINYRPGTFGVFEGLGDPMLVSEDLPQITLVSSVTTPPGVTTPEPASLVLAGAVLVLLGAVRRRKPTS